MALDHLEGGVGLWSNWSAGDLVTGGEYLFTVFAGSRLIFQVKLSALGSPGPPVIGVTVNYNGSATTGRMDDTIPEPWFGNMNSYILSARTTYPHRLHQGRFRTSTKSGASYAADGEIVVELDGVEVLNATGLTIPVDPVATPTWSFTFGIICDTGWVWATNANEFVETAGTDGEPSSLNLLYSSNWSDGATTGWTRANVSAIGIADPAIGPWFHSDSGRGGTRGISIYSTPASSTPVPAGGPGSRWNCLGFSRSLTAALVIVDPGGEYVEPPAGGTESCCCACAPTGGGNTGENPNPVGVLPPWTASCIGGGAVDAVADLSDGEDWAA